MALNDVTFVKGQGGLGRPLAGEDHISGLIFYVANPPSALATPTAYFSLEQVEALGITLSFPVPAIPSSPTTEEVNAKLAARDKNLIWYHVKEYFRIQPKGVLYLAAYTTTSIDFEEIGDMQSAADGSIRQMGIFTSTDFSNDNVIALNGIAEELYNEHKPLSILYGANYVGAQIEVDNSPVALTLTNLPDLGDNATEGNYVSVILSQDGAGTGSQIFNMYSSTPDKKSVTTLGAALGAVSRSKVSENIGWVKNFNMSEGELDVIAFAEGTSYRQVPESQLDNINTKRYIFLRKHIGINGSFFNDSHTAIAENNDYAYIENNRTIDKAVRNIRTFILPELNGPLFVDPAGKLSEDTIAYFTSVTSRPLEQMQRDQELSAFQVIIDPSQNVLSDSTLNITVKLVPVGVARQIKINIGFTVNIS